jgi:hypothetical protein
MQRSEIRGKFARAGFPGGAQAGFPGFHFIPSGLRLLDDLEDYYLAAATMERVRKGEERIYTLEEAERDLGLAD